MRSYLIETKIKLKENHRDYMLVMHALLAEREEVGGYDSPLRRRANELRCEGEQLLSKWLSMPRTLEDWKAIEFAENEWEQENRESCNLPANKHLYRVVQNPRGKFHLEKPRVNLLDGRKTRCKKNISPSIWYEKNKWHDGIYNPAEIDPSLLCMQCFKGFDLDNIVFGAGCNFLRMGE
jgi:hypothetical protein